MPLTNFAAGYKSEYLWLELFVFGLIITFASRLSPSRSETTSVPMGGVIMGLLIAVPLEQRFVDFK